DDVARTLDATALRDRPSGRDLVGPWEAKPAVPLPPSWLRQCWMLWLLSSGHLGYHFCQLGWPGTAIPHIEHARLVMAVFTCHQFIPIERAKQSPGCQRHAGYAGAACPHRLVPALDQPANLFIRARAKMRFG